MNLEGMKKKFRYQKLSFEDLVLLVDKRKEEDSFVIALRLNDVFYIYENGETHEISDKENFEIVGVDDYSKNYGRFHTPLYAVLAACSGFSQYFNFIPLDTYKPSFENNFEPNMILVPTRAKRRMKDSTKNYLGKFIQRNHFLTESYYTLYDVETTQKHIDYLQNKLNFELMYLEFIENNLLSDNDMKILKNRNHEFEEKISNQKKFGE